MDARDPLEEQRAELARIIINAQKWGTAAKWLFVTAALLVLCGAGLIAAGAMKLVACVP